MTQPSTKTATSAEEAIVFYESARNELMARVQLRDQALIAYVTIIGAYLGFVLSAQLATAPSSDRFFSETVAFAGIPFVCLCFTLIILGHHSSVRTISTYVSTELYPKRTPSHLDSSETVSWAYPFYGWFRFWGQMTVLLGPLLYGAIYSLRNAPVAQSMHQELIFSSVLLIDALVVAAVVGLHVLVELARRRLLSTYLN